jgi:PKD repeat protein
VEISRTIKPGGDNEAPEANFTFSPADPVAGTKVHFNASESTGVISKWEWDFGDGWTGAGQRTHHVFDFSADDYEDSKKFKVTLTVYDNLGKYNSTSSDISISKEPLLLTVNPSPATADKTGDTEFTLYVYKVGDIEPNESITYYRSSSVDWLAIVGTTVGVINSNNGDSFNVNPAENDSGAARDGYIYVKYYRGSQEKVVTVTVTQQINVGP